MEKKIHLPLQQLAQSDFPPKTVLFHYWGNVAPRELSVLPRHYILKDGIVLTQKVDAAGRFLAVNEAFKVVCGYSEQELIGTPTCVLRHPDMPRAIFKKMWITVARGDYFSGCIKHLRKDGGYYWTHTTILPTMKNGVVERYTAFQRKLDRLTIARMEKLYKEMRHEELSMRHF